jgi:putative thiamine transport system ATP-binding protein
LLLPHLSVAGNLLIGLHPDVKGRAGRRDAVEAALAEIGLGNLADRDPATLSGGQAARVALMRTLLARPEALVLDEPFSRLDSALRAQIRDHVFAESRHRGLPVLLVTHDPADAEAAGGRVVELG